MYSRIFLMLTFVVALQAQRYAQPQRSFYDPSGHPDLKAPNWMSFIEDERSISTLSVPGTHASLSYTKGLYGKGQSWSLTQQYESGIRFVDLHCRHHRNTLYVFFDGVSYNMYSLDGVLMETIRFLDRYPTESVLIHITREGVPINTQETMGETVRRILARYPSNRVWSSTRIPSMGEARGKVVILQDFYGPAMVGIDYRNINVEDSGKIRNIYAITWKWDRIRSHLYQAQRGSQSSMYLTYTGGSGDGVEPSTVASRINRSLWNFIMQYDGATNRWGIIAMDFPGSSLVRKIIDSNF